MAWEFVDTVYDAKQAQRIKADFKKQGYVAKVEARKTPSGIPCWWILKKKKE